MPYSSPGVYNKWHSKKKYKPYNNLSAQIETKYPRQDNKENPAPIIIFTQIAI
jgi:ribosome maturation factor RimP